MAVHKLEVRLLQGEGMKAAGSPELLFPNSCWAQSHREASTGDRI